MARFRATIQGMRGEASRLGSENSGINVSARGWDIGVTVYGFVDKDGKDIFEVYQDGGSNGWGRGKMLARIVEGEGNE